MLQTTIANKLLYFLIIVNCNMQLLTAFNSHHMMSGFLQVTFVDSWIDNWLSKPVGLSE